MKKINWLFTALAGLVLTCCTGEDLSETPPVVKPPKQDVPILFSFTRGNTTRAENYFTGAEAARLLGNKFVVTGFKGEKTATPGSIVFDNYLVEYAENTANTTESNSSNWEYVGKTPIAHATTNGITSQTIKYWDYSVDQYDFFAWSTGGKEAVYTGTYGTDQVLVTNIQPNSKVKTWTEASGDTPARIAYTFSGKAEDLAQCYISDLVTVNKEGDAGVGEVTGYNQPVTLKFRQLGTKVRIGIYETVPGYSVKDVKFYTAAAVGLTNSESDDKATLFTTTENEIYTEGTYTVYFPTVDTPTDADNNQAHIKFAPKAEQEQSTTVGWDVLNYTIRESGEKNSGKVYIGRSSNTATFAGSADKNYYEIFLPNQSGTNLNLRVNYTLESIDGSGETINVKGATAQVPLIYTTWKPGYAYTYLFKISDKTNGYTGVYDPTNPNGNTTSSNPAGLYPITFDAVVVNAEDGDQTQETITTVSAPSITTYQNGSNVVNNDEYTVLTASGKITGEIYVTVNDTDDPELTPDLTNGKLQTLTDKAALYIIPEGTTEAEIIDALQYRDDDLGGFTIMGRNKIGLKEAKDATDDTKNLLTLTNEVTYGVDGNTISVETDQAAKFTPTAATTYAFVYTKKGATTTTNKFQPVTKTQGASVSGLYRYKVENAASGDVQKGVTYFTGNQATFEKTTVFLGQDVSNMYTRTGTGTDADPYVYTAASGYAVTGTKYYYTTDNGMSYTEAVSIGYTKIAEYTFYTFDGTDYTEVTDKSGMPKANTAYYYKKSDGKYYYCVFFPQRTQGGTSLMVATDEKVACTGSETAVDGMTYFDMYTQNNGVYYTKVIKVQ